MNHIEIGYYEKIDPTYPWHVLDLSRDPLSGLRLRKRCKTKNEAKVVGKQLAKDLRFELVIKGKDGKIQDKTSYGNDDPDTPG